MGSVIAGATAGVEEPEAVEDRLKPKPPRVGAVSSAAGLFGTASAAGGVRLRPSDSPGVKPIPLR